jgi:hypothetical protein
VIGPSTLPTPSSALFTTGPDLGIGSGIRLAAFDV